MWVADVARLICGQLHRAGHSRCRAFVACRSIRTTPAAPGLADWAAWVVLVSVTQTVRLSAKIGPVAYKLELPASMGKLHDVFHVSLLEPYKTDGRHQPPPPPVEIHNAVEYEVQAIIAHRARRFGRTGQRTEYLIDWKGYGTEHRTWEPEVNLSHSPEMLKAYWAAQEQQHA